jgi:hypothetical protein
MKQLFVLIVLGTLAVSCAGSGSPAGPTPANPANPAPAIPADPTPAPQTYSGPVSTQMTVRLTIVPTTSPTNVCEFLRVFSGTLSITLTQASDGTVTGTAATTGTETESAITQSPLCTSTFGTVEFIRNRPVTGTSANIAFNGETVVDRTPAGTGSVTTTTSFTGGLSGGVISGTLTLGDAQRLVFPHPQVASVTGGGSTSVGVSLR